ncbi:MAG: glycosyltransferase family 4 protein [Petrotogales bacterium]
MADKMRLGIDASNLRSGGGVTHLVELLRAEQPKKHGFDKVIVWAGKSTLNRIDNQPWLYKINDPMLEKSLLFRLYWQRFKLTKEAKSLGCDVLFVPGGSYIGKFRPFVTMCRNMLPFMWTETRRFGISKFVLKLLLLRQTQLATFNRANGLVFLTQHAFESVERLMKTTNTKITIIHHGVNERFRQEPRKQKSISCYQNKKPYRILYVSPIAPYKHQCNVIEAIKQLQKAGLPGVLELVGSVYHKRRRFYSKLDKIDPKKAFVHYQGTVSFDRIHEIYHQADMYVFASSCENMPNILLEAMAAGLPIACSNRSPMTDILGDAGLYFDPESPKEITKVIHILIEDPELREKKAWMAYERAKLYSWKRCAHETFDFLAKVVQEFSG